MKLEERLREKLGDTEPIKGFHVMEWLRDVRDADYELSIKDPEEYRKKVERAKKRMKLLKLEQTAKRKLKK